MALERVVEDHPKFAPAWQTLGAVCNWAWRHDAAESAYREALSIDAHVPTTPASVSPPRSLHADVTTKVSRLSMRRVPASRRAAPCVAALAPWSGEPLAGTLVLHGEQGLGDVVQFARFLPRPARARGSASSSGWTATGSRWRRCSHRWKVSTRSSPTRSSSAASGRWHAASMLSLGAAGAGDARRLVGRRYLARARGSHRCLASRVDATAALRAGLAWSVHARDDHGYVTRHKSIAPEALAPLLDVGWRRIPFAATRDRRAMPSVFGSTRFARGRYRKPWIRDFGDTAALIQNLDLVITPDTAVAHVAGALGKPVWLLERFHGCWRWRLAGGNFAVVSDAAHLPSGAFQRLAGRHGTRGRRARRGARGVKTIYQ